MSGDPTSPPSARHAQLLALADELRPELHRYAARLMGSVIDGEDVVQDTFTRAFVALNELEEDAPMRAWLFRIAHNRALDLLRSRAIRAAEPIEAASDVADPQSPDPVELLMRREAVETAVSRFVELPTVQRSVVILKDVLDQSLEEIAAMLDLTVNAVKAHLARGRTRLKAINAQAPTQPAPRSPSPDLARYVALFNRRDWDGLRGMLADDVRLIQSTYPLRAGAADVGMFFGIYSRSAPVRLALAWLDGREVIAVYEDPQAVKPSYMMWLEWRDGRISFIRDYKYVRYVIDDAELVLVPDARDPRGRGRRGLTAPDAKPAAMLRRINGGLVPIMVFVTIFSTAMSSEANPAHVSLLVPTRTVPLSQVASTATAVFVTFPRAATLLLISTFRDTPMKIALSGLMP